MTVIIVLTFCHVPSPCSLPAARLLVSVFLKLPNSEGENPQLLIPQPRPQARSLDGRFLWLLTPTRKLHIALW